MRFDVLLRSLRNRLASFHHGGLLMFLAPFQRPIPFSQLFLEIIPDFIQRLGPCLAQYQDRGSVHRSSPNLEINLLRASKTHLSV